MGTPKFFFRASFKPLENGICNYRLETKWKMKKSKSYFTDEKVDLEKMGECPPNHIACKHKRRIRNILIFKRILSTHKMGEVIGNIYV